MKVENVIIEPIVTEKTNIMRDAHKYVFKVDARANKFQVMAAVKELFQVHPVACHIVNVKGKPRRVRYKLGLTSSWKKAIVTIPAEEKIAVFEGA
jgi:large subunit ribosomal protein L23